MYKWMNREQMRKWIEKQMTDGKNKIDWIDREKKEGKNDKGEK